MYDMYESARPLPGRDQYAIVNADTGEFVTKSSFDHTICWYNSEYGYVALFDNKTTAQTQVTRHTNSQKKHHGNIVNYKVVEIEVVVKPS